MTDRTEEQKIADLSAAAKTLPREIDPPPDAWAAIKAEIDRDLASRRFARKDTAVWQKPAFLVAAGLSLMVGSSVVTDLALNRSTKQPHRPAASTDRVTRARPASGPATLAEFAAVETDYISTANQLSAILESEKTTLSPATVAKLRESLRIIDAAIVEARRALAADPANRELIEMLNTSYAQKLDLLRRTTEMGRS